MFFVTVRMVGFEPRAPTYSLVARAPEARGVARLSHILFNEERLVRIELTISAWQADGLPLHHRRRLLAQPNCQRSRAPRPTSTSVPGIELTQPLYESGVIPLDHQCIFSRVGSVGIEPTSAGLRDRCITLSATIPNKAVGVRL